MAANAVYLQDAFHPDVYVDYFHSTTIDDMKGAFFEKLSEKKGESEEALNGLMEKFYEVRDEIDESEDRRHAAEVAMDENLTRSWDDMDAPKLQVQDTSLNNDSAAADEVEIIDDAEEGEAEA